MFLNVFLMVATRGMAQSGPNTSFPLGGAAGAPGAKTCVQVQVGGQTADPFACLNQDLQDQALAASGQPNASAPLSAGSPSNTTGVFNQTGLAEQYGKNFGVSATPYRPPPPVFANSLH